MEVWNFDMSRFTREKILSQPDVSTGRIIMIRIILLQTLYSG